MTLDTVLPLLSSSNPVDVQQGLALLHALNDPTAWAALAPHVTLRDTGWYPVLSSDLAPDAALAVFAGAGLGEGVEMLRLDGLSDYAPLAAFPHLTTIQLHPRPGAPLDGLSAAPALTHLMIWADGHDVAPLPVLPRVVQLGFFECAPPDLAGLATACPNLTHLTLFESQEVDLSPLAALPALTEISLFRGWLIPTLAPLAGCRALTTLTLDPSAPRTGLDALRAALPHLRVVLDG